jgi:hypothetical protein
MEVSFDMAMYLFSTAVIILGAYQLILMCYLYLLGPIAAAFYAWPSLTQNNKLFRTVFGNWINAVITTALWRFYWMVILAIMTQRILYLMDNGAGQLDLQWEVAVFTCLLGLMFYVPFNPFVFDPAQAWQAVSQAGSSMMSGQSQGAQAGGGGLQGALGQAAIAGGANPAQVQSLQKQVTGTTNTMGQAGLSAPLAQEQSQGVLPGGGYNPAARQQSLTSQGSSQPSANAAAVPNSSPRVAPPPMAGGGSNFQTANAIAPPGTGTGGGGPAGPPPASPQALHTVASATGASAQSMTSPTPGLVPPTGASPSTPVASVNGNVPAATVAASVGAPPPSSGGGGGDVLAAGATVAALSGGNNSPPPPLSATKDQSQHASPYTPSGVEGAIT